MKVRCHLTISGRVQGVNFRFYTCEKARQWGLSGWVRNRWEGDVEIVAEGEEEKVQKFVNWAHKGPPGARVERVKLMWETYAGEFHDFKIVF